VAVRAGISGTAALVVRLVETVVLWCDRLQVLAQVRVPRGGLVLFQGWFSQCSLAFHASFKDQADAG